MNRAPKVEGVKTTRYWIHEESSITSRKELFKTNPIISKVLAAMVHIHETQLREEPDPHVFAHIVQYTMKNVLDFGQYSESYVKHVLKICSEEGRSDLHEGGNSPTKFRWEYALKRHRTNCSNEYVYGVKSLSGLRNYVLGLDR